MTEKLPDAALNERVAAIALDLEVSASDSSLESLTQALIARAGIDADPDVSSLLALDGRLCSLWLAGPEPEEDRAGHPLLYWDPGSYPDDCRPYLDLRAAQSMLPEARARYHEVIAIRWREHLHVREAHRQYLEIIQATDVDDRKGINTMHMAVRAIRISLGMNHELESTGKIVRAEVRRGLGAATVGYASWLVEYGAKLIVLDPEDAKRLLGEIGTSAETASATGDWHREHTFLDACAQLAAALKDDESRNTYLMRKAASHESLGRGSDSGIAGLHYLTKAAEIYKDLGLSQDAQRIKTAMLEAGARAQGEMETISGKISLDRSVFETSARNLTIWNDDTPAGVLLLPIQIGTWPTWESIEQRERTQASGSIVALMSHVRIESDARSNPDPDDEAKRAQSRLHAFAASWLLQQTGIAPAYLDVLRENGRWNVERIEATLGVVDQTLRLQSHTGIRALESGDHWTAVHVLIPQLERLIRLLGEQVGASVTSYTPTTGLRWRDMGDILAEPAVRDALSEDFARELEVLFVSQFGSNMRNDFAHGALDYWTVGASKSIMTLFAILTVGLRLLIARGQVGPVDD